MDLALRARRTETGLIRCLVLQTRPCACVVRVEHVLRVAGTGEMGAETPTGTSPPGVALSLEALGLAGSNELGERALYLSPNATNAALARATSSDAAIFDCGLLSFRALLSTEEFALGDFLPLPGRAFRRSPFSALVVRDGVAVGLLLDAHRYVSRTLADP